MGPFLNSSTLEQLVGAPTCQPCGHVNVTLLLMHWGVMAGDSARDQVCAKSVIAPVGAGKHKHGKHVQKVTCLPGYGPLYCVSVMAKGQHLLGILHLLCFSAEIISQALLWYCNMPREMLPALS